MNYISPILWEDTKKTRAKRNIILDKTKSPLISEETVCVKRELVKTANNQYTPKQKKSKPE
jgi:hypothetical protein